MVRVSEEVLRKTLALISRKSYSHGEIPAYIEVFGEIEEALRLQTVEATTDDTDDTIQSANGS